MIQAVIFDIDDTLYAYAPCDAAGTAQMHRLFSQEFPCTRTEFDELLQQAKKDVKSLTANTAACHNRLLYAQRLCELAGVFSADLVLELYNAYWDTFLETMQIYDHVYEVFEMLRAKGIRIGFCTDLTAHIQMRKISRLNIMRYADAVVTSEECGVEKPAALPFRRVLEKLGVSSFSEAIMIGDDYIKDISGALNAGMQAIHFSSEKQHPVHTDDFHVLETILRGSIS